MIKKLYSIISSIPLSSAIFCGGLTLFILFAWGIYTYELDLRLAYDGFLLIPWVFNFSGAVNFSKDFLSSMSLFDKSAFLHIYPLIYKYFGIPPETLVYIIILFEIAIIAWAFYALAHTVFPKSSKFAVFLIIVLAIASYARSMDLGRYDEPYFGGFYNNVPIALGIFAIIAFLKGWYIWSGILLAGSFMGHSVRGVIHIICIFAMLMAKPREILKPRLIIGAIFFIILVISWVFFIYRSGNVLGTAIPDKIWYEFSKFSYHLYPVDLRLFTSNFDKRLIYLISYSLLFVFYISRIKPLRDIDRKIIFGILSIVILTIAGVIFSIFTPSTALVKISFQRASELSITLAFVYVINGLWCEIEGPSAIWRKFVAGIILASPFLLMRGFPIIYSVLITSSAWLPVLIGKRLDIRDRVITIFVIAIAALVIFYTRLGIPLNSSGYTGGFYFFAIAVILLGALFTISNFLLKKVDDQRRKSIIAVLFLVFCCLFWAKSHMLSPEQRSFRTNYKTVQLWAKDNTPENTLFMTDPLIYYGWREYSRRSSFGNLREWLHTGWVYTSDFKLYNEGMKRFNEFSVNLNDYLGAKPTIDEFDKASYEVKRRYYSLGDQWRLDLAKRYGIDYFILIKSEIKEPSKMKVAFENKDFIVLKP